MKKFIQNPLFAFNLIMLVGFLLVYWKMSDMPLRNPAAIQKVELFDFSNLDGEDLKSAVMKQILKDFEIKKNKNNFEFRLGNFIVQKENGEPLYLCDYYNELIVTFEAEGMASGGERPSLRITTSCRSDSTMKYIEKIIIPVNLVKGKKVEDTDMEYDQQPNTKYQFRNIQDFWPDYWVLSNVRMAHSQFPNRELNLNRLTIYQNTQVPPTMSWE